MLVVFLFVLAVFVSFIHAFVAKERKFAETFLAYLIFFNMGVMGLLAAYAHVFMGPAIAKQIGWAPGSPFQFEIGMANLSYGVIGIIAFWIRRGFWEAAIVGWSVLLLGCFAGHMIDFLEHGNTAPLNIGVFVWFNDLFLPLFALSLLAYVRRRKVS